MFNNEQTNIYIYLLFFLISVIFLSVTLGLASGAIVFTILVIRLYHKPSNEVMPDWVHTLARKLKNCTCKRKRKSDNRQQNNGTDMKEVNKDAWKETDETGNIKIDVKYTNKELSRLLDVVCFIVFTIIYCVVCVCFTMTLVLSG